MALTVRQRDWARRVYSYSGELRCHFVLYSEERGFYYCGSTERVEIHHIVPQGWCRRILRVNPDYPKNLIAICKYNHVAYGYKGTLNHHEEVVPVIHPDMGWAYRNYSKRENSFGEVFTGREEMTDKGEKYWNDDWSIILQQVAYEFVSKYLRENPDDPFPR